MGNKTSLITVMRGLLAPGEHRYIEKLAIEKAENQAKIFVDDVNFLFSVMNDQQTSKLIRRYSGKVLLFLKENIRSAKLSQKSLTTLQ